MQTPRVAIRPAPAYEADPAAPPRRGTPSIGAGVPRSPRVSRATAVEARSSSITIVALLFEVLDRRRNATHLYPQVGPRVAEWATELARVGIRRPESTRPEISAQATRVQRLHLQMSGPAVGQIFGSYTRGERIEAFAGRIEKLPVRMRGSARSEYRWQLVEFTLGPGSGRATY